MSLKQSIKKIPGVVAVRNFQLAFSAPIRDIFDSRKKIKAYKNSYNGKRCFIIGNGPSLTPADLDLIKNEVSFAANTIYKIFSKTSWRPTFYCIQDNKVLMDISKDDLLNETKDCKATFVRMYSSRIVRANNIKLNNLIYVPILGKVTKNYSAPFSDKADKYVYDGSMVTYLFLQLAVYMGFDRIYLIGMDHNFPFNRTRNGKIEVNDISIPVHFWESAETNNEGDRIDLHANYQELAENSYKEAERYSRESKRCRIFNATRGGKLEIFERVNLDDIMGGETR